MVSFLLILSAPLAMQAPLTMQTAPMRPMPRAVSPNMQVAPQGEAVRANLKPDLVVKEMRKDGNTLHVLIANEGSADTVAVVRVSGDARYRSLRGRSADAYIGPLKTGATEWVEFAGFTDDDQSYPTTPRLLGDWDQVTVVVDPPAYEGTVPGVPTTPSDMMAKRTCTTAHGCIVELDETNNSLTAATATMAAWNGE
jgi:hypothetical protein